MKKMFHVSTKTIIATGLGAALFTLLFMYAQVPTGLFDTSVQIAFGLGAFFAALFGPIAGGLIAFIGHAISDSIHYGAPWWSWVIASGVSMFLVGFVHTKIRADEGEFGWKDVLRFNIYQVIANVFAWIIVAPALDVLIYTEPLIKVLLQGTMACLWNTIACGVIGTLLLFAYAKIRPKKGSLSKEQE